MGNAEYMGTPELVGKLPGSLSPSTGVSFADVPNGLAAISKVPGAGWAQIIAYCAFTELAGNGEGQGETGEPGNMGWRPPLLASDDPATRRTKLSAELGVQAPFGFWDPMGLCKDGDTDAFNRRRVTEIKHGRVSMWACLGYITPEY